jgi:hypothetical protein
MKSTRRLRSLPSHTRAASGDGPFRSSVQSVLRLALAYGARNERHQCGEPVVRRS